MCVTVYTNRHVRVSDLCVYWLCLSLSPTEMPLSKYIDQNLVFLSSFLNKSLI
jgi:hypothetical protein